MAVKKAKKSPQKVAKKSAKKVAAPPDFKRHKRAKAPSMKRISEKKLTGLASKLVERKLTFPWTTVMELSARHPYDDAGNMDFYMPGRWDTSINLVFMDAIVTGPEPGEWNGTVGYVAFKSPATGLYIVVANFTGYQVTMSLYGPWGTNSAYNDTNDMSSAVLAAWNGNAGDTLYFNLSLTGPVLGYLESIQVLQFA